MFSALFLETLRLSSSMSSSNAFSFDKAKILLSGKRLSFLFLFFLRLVRIELANQKLTTQRSYSYVYQGISSKQLLQISRRHGLNYTKWYLLLIIFVYLSSLPVAHLSDAPRRRLVVMGDSARIQDETTENSA